MQAKRINGPTDPHLVERLDPNSPVYAVRWDVRPNNGGMGSAAWGVNYMEAILTHRPTLDEVRMLIAEWSDGLAEEMILSGLTYQGHPVWLSTENQINYATDYTLAVMTGGESLPMTVRLGTLSDPVYLTLKTMDEATDFIRSVRQHILDCQSEGWNRKENIDYLLYEEYLKQEETMTELQKAKAEKQLELTRQKATQSHYYVNETDIYLPAYQRAALKAKAERGEQVEVQSIEMDPDVALKVLDGMAAHADLVNAICSEKLNRLELAESVQEVAAIDAAKDYPEPVRTTLEAIQTELETEAANSPTVQAVLFAKQMINDVPMSANLALKRKVLFPVWGEEGAEFGKKVPVGFRFRFKAEDAEEYSLIEVIQQHNLSKEWVPGMDTASIYKIVQEEHAGTLDDPIPYTQSMAFEAGKYYEQYDVIYHCILTTQTGYPNDLKDLQTIVEPVIKEEETA